MPFSPSSPVVAGERLFLTAFVDGALQTRCHRTVDGQLVWSKGVKPEKLESFHGSEEQSGGVDAGDGWGAGGELLRIVRADLP